MSGASASAGASAGAGAGQQPNAVVRVIVGALTAVIKVVLFVWVAVRLPVALLWMRVNTYLFHTLWWSSLVTLPDAPLRLEPDAAVVAAERGRRDRSRRRW